MVRETSLWHLSNDYGLVSLAMISMLWPTNFPSPKNCYALGPEGPTGPPRA